jgi:AraC-like DNA-binding protein
MNVLDSPTATPKARPFPLAAPVHDASSFEPRFLPVPEALRPYVNVLMGVEIGALAPLPLSIAPHDSLMLTVQLGRHGGCSIEAKGEHGDNTCLTGIRHWTGSFIPAGHCVTLFALLTPLGAVQVLDSQPLSSVPRIRARVAELLDRSRTRRLESGVALAGSLDAKLRVFAAWIEARASAQRRLAPPALRAARAAMRLCAQPAAAIDDLADGVHVSRRQLERDFGHWIGTSPRHLAQVSRVQAVSRKAHAGASLADIAADTGFADQAHMTRVVRQLTGLTPRHFVRSCSTPMATAFRAASGGGTVYL